MAPKVALLLGTPEKKDSEEAAESPSEEGDEEKMAMEALDKIASILGVSEDDREAFDGAMMQFVESC